MPIPLTRSLKAAVWLRPSVMPANDTTVPNGGSGRADTKANKPSGVGKIDAAGKAGLLVARPKKSGLEPALPA